MVGGGPWGWMGVLALIALLLAAVTSNARAHDIPNDVHIQAFVKPEGQQLQLLVRVPLVVR